MTRVSRRSFLLATLAAPAALAQRAREPKRVAYIWIFDQGPSAPYQHTFRSRMQELGWTEGRSLVAEYRSAEGSPEKLRHILQDVIDRKVDVIVAMCTPEAVVAKKLTSTVPIVVAAGGDFALAGLVDDMAKPGGNITGMSAMLLQLSAKRMEMLGEVAPKARKACVIWNPQRRDNELEVKAMQRAGNERGIELRSLAVRSREEVGTALDAIGWDGTQALLNCGDTLLTAVGEPLVRRVRELGIPAIYESRHFVEIGGLMSYGPDFQKLHRRAAEYVDKILRGAAPGSLPIEQPTRFELVINRRAARELGWTIPQSLALRADAILE